MRIQNHYIKTTILAFTLLFASCASDYLDTFPSNAVSGDLVGSSIENLYMALNGIHRKMVSQDKAVQYVGGYPGFMINMDAQGDDMTWANNTLFKTTHQWAEQSVSESAITRLMWWSYYEFILNANLILSHVDKYESSNPEDFKIVKGEALCFRAFSHFMLVQTYASRYIAGKENEQLGVPYRMEVTQRPMARNSVRECYDNIITDLDNAFKLLQGYKPVSVSHFSPIVVLGLRARVALAQQDYATAAEKAREARELALEAGYALMNTTNINNGFANISTKTKEALWAALTLSDQTVNYYSFNALMSWNYNSEPVRLGTKQISQTLYHAMSTTDLRRSWWDEKGILPLPSSNYTAYAYSNRKFTSRSVDNPVSDVAFMRLAELYLIEAEALARDGNYSEAQDVLELFVSTRDPEYSKSTLTRDALIEEIMIHRRVELWGEGFRFFDLKRLGENLNRTGDNFNAGFCIVKEVMATDPRWQWAIPQDEISANDLMKQNVY